MIERPDATHEAFDIRAQGLLGWGVGVLLLIAVCLAGVWLLLGALGGVASPAGGGVSQIPPPRLQVDGSVDLRALQTEKRAALDAYGWVDRQAGIAHIPIQRAMALLANRAAPPPSEGGPPP